MSSQSLSPDAKPCQGEHQDGRETKDGHDVGRKLPTSSSSSSNPSSTVRVVEKDEVSGNKSAPIRRSNRDVNSIRLSGTASTFYRRLHELFFSNPFHKRDYERLILNGCCRRRNFGIGCGGSLISKSKQGIVKVNRESRRRDAPIYVIDNFLTESELDYFDKTIASVRFERSFVDNMNYDDDNGADDQDEIGDDHKSRTQTTGGDDDDSLRNPVWREPPSRGSRKKAKKRTLLDDSHRTSTFFSFRKLHDAKIRALEQRVANLFGCWVHQIEALQLVRYAPGQFFGIHHDMGDLMEDDQVRLPRKHLAVKRRLVTLFCYLNTLEESDGGGTYFPMCNLRVQPRRGRAVLWSNVTAEGQADPRTIHAGEPVRPTVDVNTDKCDGSKRVTREGVNDGRGDTMKYGLNIWICEE